MAEVVKLGSEVKDKFTGFSGIAMARTHYLFGCDRIGVLSPKLEKETGEPKEYIWFDEQQLTEVKIEEKGGPRQDAPSR